MKKKLSIIIPVYNTQQYLNKLLSSLENQLTEKIEVIFIDDGSNDGSLQTLKDFCIKDNRILLIQKHSGAPAARNLGIQKSIGEYLYFFDSDDYLVNNILKSILNQLETSEPDILIGNGYVLSEAGNVIGDKFSGLLDEINTDTEKLFFIDSNPGNKIYKKEIIEKYNIWYDNVAIQQDLNFYLKYIIHCHKIQYIHNYMYYYLIREESIAHKVSPKIADVIKSLEYVSNYYKTYGFYEQYKEELNYNLIKHICFQIDKIPFLKEKAQREDLVNLFSNRLIQISWETNLFIKEYQKDCLKRFFCLKESIKEGKDSSKQEIEILQDEKNRLEIYYETVLNWVSNMINGISISQILEKRKVYKIAIYGMGTLGKLLIDNLRHSNNIKIEYLIDQMVGEKYFNNKDLTAITPNKINEMDPVDAIIITPVHKKEIIKKQLKKSNHKLIIYSLDELLIENNKL